MPDLGQDNCLNNFKKIISANNFEKSIVYAGSQGTATALNYVMHEDKRNIKALILEGILLSGNSAIEHMLGVHMKCSKITELPLSYYWLPYVAKALLFLYRPSGKQPIKHLKNIPNELLIIIVHSKQDTQLPYKDACALYYGLRSQGNNNVYLISNEGTKHLNILSNKGDHQVIRSILMKHGLLHLKDAETRFGKLSTRS